MASSPFEDEVRAFVKSYAALFASPDASSAMNVKALASTIGKQYRPGVTFFTEGEISRFDNQTQAGQLIEKEMRNNIDSGLGTCLILDSIDSITTYSQSSAVCWLRWTFHPQASSEYAGRTWSFVNIYGYRAASKGSEAGWEYVVRDNEVSEMRKVVGKAFNE